jgi:Arc/MetJ-type ribon-helix-helix transcriptional regulator
VSEGTYTSISDYVRDLIRIDVEKTKKVEQVRWLVREGTDALDRGEGRALTPELFEGIKASDRAHDDK